MYFLSDPFNINIGGVRFYKTNIKASKSANCCHYLMYETSNLVGKQNQYINNESQLHETCGESGYLNCVIAKDASKKLDFLILVIETLQINATDSLFLKAKNIGLSDDFSSRVQFWKIRCSNPLRNNLPLNLYLLNRSIHLLNLFLPWQKTFIHLLDNYFPLKNLRHLIKSDGIYFSRLKSLITERMNVKRSYITSLINDDNNEYFKELLVILSLSCGKGGACRLKASLYHQY